MPILKLAKIEEIKKSIILDELSLGSCLEFIMWDMEDPMRRLEFQNEMFFESCLLERLKDSDSDGHDGAEEGQFEYILEQTTGMGTRGKTYCRLWIYPGGGRDTFLVSSDSSRSKTHPDIPDRIFSVSGDVLAAYIMFLDHHKDERSRQAFDSHEYREEVLCLNKALLDVDENKDLGPQKFIIGWMLPIPK